MSEEMFMKISSFFSLPSFSFPLPSSPFPLWFLISFPFHRFQWSKICYFHLPLVRERREELEMMIMINIISFPSSLAFVYFARKRKEGIGKERDFNFASLPQVATKIRAEKQKGRRRRRYVVPNDPKGRNILSAIRKQGSNPYTQPYKFSLHSFFRFAHILSFISLLRLSSTFSETL